jgi:hypothetical protein
MLDIFEYCIGGVRRNVAAGAEVLHEGGRTGHLYVLIEGRLEVVKGDTVVATLTEPGAVLGEMSVLLDQPHTATVRAAQDSAIYQIEPPRSYGSSRRWRSSSRACWRSGSMSPTPISPISSGNMPATATISRWSAISCRA